MKKWFLMLLGVMLFCSAALAENAVPPAAEGLIPASARLMEKDTEDGLTEYEYRDGNTRYDLKVRGDTLLMLETDNPAAAYDEKPIGTGEAAIAAALAHLPGAETDTALTYQKDRRTLWGVFLRLNGDAYEVVLDAATSRVVEITRFFGAADVLRVDEFWQRVYSAKGQAQLASVSLEYDDGRLIYQGEATLEGRRYEFDALASDGTLLEWEKD